MKCKLCGAVFDDDTLFFCTGCGAMLRNPATGEIVPENREEYTPTADELSEAAQSADDSPEAALINEKPAEEPTVEVPPVTETAETAENPETEDAPDIPESELYIVRDREKAASAEELPPEYEQIPEPLPEEAPPKPAKVGAGRLIGATLISFIACVILVAVSLLFSLKLGVSGDILHDRAQSMNVWTVINAHFNGMSLSDNLYYETDFDKATHGFADKTEFSLYLAKSSFTNFFADKLKQYGDYILENRGDETTLKESELIEFFMSNSESAKEVFGYEMQTADYNSIRSSLSENKTEEKFSVSKIGWELRFRLENIRYILSGLTLGIIGALFVVLLIWLAVIVNRSGRRLLGFYGGIFFWGGLVTLSAGVLTSLGAAMAYVLTGELWYCMSATLLLPTSIYAACIGAILLIAGIILLKVKKAIKRRVAADGSRDHSQAR